MAFFSRYYSVKPPDVPQWCFKGSPISLGLRQGELLSNAFRRQSLTLCCCFHIFPMLCKRPVGHPPLSLMQEGHDPVGPQLCRGYFYQNAKMMWWKSPLLTLASSLISQDDEGLGSYKVSPCFLLSSFTYRKWYFNGLNMCQELFQGLNMYELLLSSRPPYGAEALVVPTLKMRKSRHGGFKLHV